MFSENFTIDTSIFKQIITVKNKDEMFKTIASLNHKAIFHRSWMGSYDFAADLVKNFDNVIVNIKDWNFAPQNVYEFLYQDNNDYESISYIFKNCKKILSHFTKEQYLLWEKEYNIDKNKFTFFPEFCNNESFVDKKRKEYDIQNIRLVYAGKISSTTLPEDYFPGKSHLRSLKILTKKNINIDFVLPPEIYNDIFNEQKKYMDFVYLNQLNPKFNIVKGEVLNPNILNKYDFGFFELETTGLNHMLYKYAVTSKFSFYLEALLPLLVNEKFSSMAKLVRDNNLGIVFNNNDLENLDKKLNITNEQYQNFVKSIIKFRTKFTYNNINLDILGII